MMRKVVVIDGKDPTVVGGGVETYARAYGRALLMAGYEPHHFCVGARTEEEKTDFGLVHRAMSPFRPFRSFMLAAHQPFLIACVNRFVGSLEGRVLIHSFGAWSGVGAAAARRLRRRGREVVTLATPFTTCHHEMVAKLRGLPAGSPISARLQARLELLWTLLTVDPSERRGLRESGLVLVNYASVEALVQARFGPSIRFARMTYCSETAFLRKDDSRSADPAGVAALSPRDAPLIVAISRHDPRKGLDTLLRALAELNRRGISCRACLVGGGELLSWHRGFAERLGLSRSTAIVGRVPDSYSYLEQADIFVLPSLEEGSGSVSLLEAMQAGIAPVVSRVDGLPEDITEGRNGLLVPPGDEVALADALGRLIVDSDLRRRIARGARECYEQRYSARVFASDLRAAYSALGFAPDLEDEPLSAPGLGRLL